MTEAAPQAEVTESEATEAEKPSFPDEMAEMSFNMLAKLTNDRNAEVGKINAVKGDRMTLTEQLEENSTNPEAVKAREARDKAQEALDEAIMSLHKVVQPEVDNLLKDAESSVTEIEEKVKEFDAKIKPGLAYFKKMYGENLAKHLPAMARLKGFSTRGAGSSGRRIRGYVVDVTVDGETTHLDNIAGAAKYLDVDTADLQKLFFDAAGNPEALKDAPDEVTFSVKFTDTYEDESTEEKTATVVCRRTKDTGVPSASSDSDEDESADDSE